MGHEFSDIYEVAAACRVDFEKGLVDPEALIKLFPEYLLEAGWNSTTVRALMPHFPQYNCTLATVYLLNRLGTGSLLELDYVTDAPEGHTVGNVGQTALSELVIADITADQYGGPAVYVGRLVDPWVLDNN